MEVKFTWNKKAREKLNTISEEITYAIARRTLDTTINIVPRKTGELRTATMGYGVQQNGSEVSIGSDTNYANYVYNMNDSSTNWTTKGTHSKWFGKVWKEQGASITQQIVKEKMLK